ncbi:thioredoxin domain-containing protein [Mucilaginibacter myungsuensis]|uniref:Thioredoxin domain-containing protein n=1 Tax=Mucilaginibacter myungsuensis TaxID=649104 RepID=A0A929KRT2_9SPHI|nr:thioredoxin domain-containing protein [Mucilaginibacter myungsuensis]MBE9660326.1 thioredoxin domain-containing protein [Mucilaginibacter myungsuensis]MDN3600368.1 thioredoxin domain-containing protein [Mucilaginibacter myungsuensis]
MNRLANSSSPYLLQHANNPVDWFPWGPEALQKAKDENKLILVSIGYSACHWCHVMEHESFEDEAVAAVMNEHFVCIKVDREERPDVDQIYMSAVQLMTGRGGWPLNCICLPDQRPIYGGTYFRKNDWTSLLFNLADFYQQKPDEAADYADKLTAGIKQYESVTFVKDAVEYTKADLEKIVENWKRYFDTEEGGMGNSPKFPMPNNWLFLMRYAHYMWDGNIANIVTLTLKKMAYGGIYDQIGGGFARYSVDKVWHIPHFEKMLYDNAQLISLYAEAYTWQGDDLYKQVVEETIDFVQRELMSPDLGFYSALDADSEGVEGKFYSFSKAELDEVLGIDAQLFGIYYNVTEHGNWEEEETNVFFRRDDDEELAAKIGISTKELREVIQTCKVKLMALRDGRVRPGLDNKILASWNGLMLRGLCDAYKAFDKPEYLELALKNAEFITKQLINADGKVNRIYNADAVKGDADPIAFLDDYANIIDAFIGLYEVTFDISWLEQAKELTNVAIEHFYDEANGIFFYTDDQEQLIARKSEIMDGVIPSSNSVMARNLKKLSLVFEDERYEQIAAQQLRNIFTLIAKYGSSYSNWAILLQEEIFGLAEVAVTGPEFQDIRWELEQTYAPNKIILGGTAENLPLLQNRVGERTLIYVCKNKTCGLPVDNVADALKQIAG